MQLGRNRPWRGLLAAAILALAAGALSWSSATWRPDSWIYDILVGSWLYAPSDRVVIVAVDEQSLTALGQWPWSRSVHATLIERLGEAGARGIAFDILLSEPGRDGDNGDAALADAMLANGRVVLPVLPEHVRDGGPMIESMQALPADAKRTSFGHTDVELDPDEVARRLYLQAGLGDAHWPALGLALLQLDEPRRGMSPPGLRASTERPRTSPYLWTRDRQVLMRYAGPPGAFHQVSYVDVLNGRVPRGLLRGRWVVVGVTAGNLGRMFLTPMSSTLRMTGAEYQANVVEMLLQGKAILPMSPITQAALSAVMVLLLTLIATSYGSRRPWTTTMLGIAALLAFCVLLLRGANVWFAPMAAILVVLAAHLLWTLGHLRNLGREVHLDALTRIANRRGFDQSLAHEVAAARRTGTSISLLLIDIDFFKSYNDSMGHRAGDQVLADIAALIAEHARRPRDLAARFGGDEFALVLPDTPEAGARRVAESLVVGVRTLNIPHARALGSDRITLSIGAHTSYPGHTTSPKTVYEAADAALYRAKQRGRDGFETSGPSGGEESP